MSSFRSAVLALAASLGFAVSARAQEAPAPHPGEASSGFDAEDVAPVLLRVSRLLSSGLDAADARSLARRINTQALESEKVYEYRVTYRGTRVDLRIVAFMDDIEAVDVAFFTSPALADAIAEQIAAYMEEVGK